MRTKGTVWKSMLHASTAALSGPTYSLIAIPSAGTLDYCSLADSLSTKAFIRLWLFSRNTGERPGENLWHKVNRLLTTPANGTLN